MASFNVSWGTLAVLMSLAPVGAAHASGEKIINGQPVTANDPIAALTVFITVNDAECGGGSGSCS